MNPKKHIKDALLGAWRPALAILGAVLVSALLLRAFGYDAGHSLAMLYDASFSNLRVFGSMLNRACPLLFTGIAVAIAYRGSVFNIGADGQFLAGAIVSAWIGIKGGGLPGPLLILLMVLGGTLAGAAWAFLPGFLKARYEISEVITTIMFNYIAIQLVGYLVRGPLRDMAQAEPQSYAIAAQGWLSYLIPKTKLHPGFIIGCIVAVVIFILLFKSWFGYEVRAVGYNPIASKYAGISVTRTTLATMLLSGALCGLGGFFEVAGASHYLYESLSSGYGYTAIAVSILAGNNPIGVIFSASLFGFLTLGATAMQRVIGVSAQFTSIVQGIIIIFVAAASVKGLQKTRRKAEKGGH
ncbi:MAG: ABC transporter permease [Christensenellaceae bacterium]|jgi:simple sugar transport system permease protein|nr:ABC transporter permease [Christensenellaceae bacterium]